MIPVILGTGASRYEAIVYVAGRENHRIQVFDGNGTFETLWNNMHRPSDLFRERGAHPRFYIGEIGDQPHPPGLRSLPKLVKVRCREEAS